MSDTWDTLKDEVADARYELGVSVLVTEPDSTEHNVVAIHQYGISYTGNADLAHAAENRRFFKFRRSTIEPEPGWTITYNSNVYTVDGIYAEASNEIDVAVWVTEP